jgi:hypothetical protein
MINTNSGVKCYMKFREVLMKPQSKFCLAIQDHKISDPKETIFKDHLAKLKIWFEVFRFLKRLQHFQGGRYANTFLPVDSNYDLLKWHGHACQSNKRSMELRVGLA